jgi:hypothetical protein
VVWIAVLGLLGWFVARMAQIEPLTGDGWYNADDVKEGLSLQLMSDQLTHLHNNGNPRIGQAFTLLTYGSRAFHVIATPLITLALFVLVVAHALRRWPRLTSAHDGLLILVGAACCFLAVPQPGHAFFYRPITTNYLYTLVLSLAFFLPQRLDLRVKATWSAAVAGLLLFLTGIFIGKTNEHTGPAMILVAAGFALYALRTGSKRDAAWRAAATAGLVIGYLFLFFAPGQGRRYGALGRQSVLQTITERGVMGTADLLGEYCRYIGPLLFVVCVLMLLIVPFQPPQLSAEQRERIKWTVFGYVGVSCLVLGTTLAAPKNHYRLFIAPSVLLVIAAIAALQALHGRWAASLLAVTGVVVCGATAWIFVPMFSAIHEDELARNAVVEQADPNRAIYVPRTRYPKRNPYYYGDSLVADPRHRDRMATLFGVSEIRVQPKPPDPTKTKKTTKRKATVVPDGPALPSRAEIQPDGGAAP